MDISELVDNFKLLEDWEDKYSYLISLGNILPTMDNILKTEDTKVKGCISQVWLVLGLDKTQKINFLADSDAKIVRGLVAVLFIIFNGKSINEVKNLDIDDIFKKIGLEEHLSPNRRNGFFSMLKRINNFIEEYN